MTDQNLTDYTKLIGMNIRYERKKRNLTIDQLAQMIGIAAAFLGLIERGQRCTSINNLVKIAELFDITLDQLITTNLSEERAKLELFDEEDGETLAENLSAKSKITTINAMMNELNSNELEFLMDIIKSLRKLKRSIENNYCLIKK